MIYVELSIGTFEILLPVPSNKKLFQKRSLFIYVRKGKRSNATVLL